MNLYVLLLSLIIQLPQAAAAPQKRWIKAETLSGVNKAQAADDTVTGQLQKDLDEVTTRLLQNKIIWTGDYSGYVDSFVDENHLIKSQDSAFGQLRHRLRLGLRAEPNKYLRFTGRLAAYKNFLTVNAITPTTEDRTYPSLRPTDDALLRIDRMYMDIFTPWQWLSGAFGLFPSSEGLPSDLHRMQPRKSTFPNMLFNIPLAAGIVALHPHYLLPALPEMHFWYIHSSSFDSAQVNQTGYSVSSPTIFDVKRTSQVHIWVLEMSPKVSWAEQLNLNLSYGLVKDFKVSNDATTLASYRASGVNFAAGDNLGSIDRLVFSAQFEQIAKTGLNAFVGIATMPMSGNEPLAKQMTATITGNSSIVGAPYIAKTGLHGTIHKENTWGMAYMGALSYDLPFSKGILGHPTVGYEFFYAAKDYLPAYTAGDDITSRLETIGQSHKFYVTQPVTDSLKLHLSYSHIRQRYTNNTLEVFVPAQGPATISGVPVIAATTGADINSVSRAGRTLHAVQFMATMGF